MYICVKFVDMYVSTKDEAISKININVEKIVCLTISNLIFSFLLSFIIELYNFTPLTANANVPGITIKFCKNKLEKQNIIPFPNPNALIIEDIV